MPDKIEKSVFIASAMPYNVKTAVEISEEDEESEFLENLIFSEDQSTATMSRETISNVVFGGASKAQIDALLPKLVVQSTIPFFEKVITLKAQIYGQKMSGIVERVTLEYGHAPLETRPEKLANALHKVGN